MTMEELVIAVRVTAEDAEAAIESLCGGFSQLGRSGEAGLAAVQRSRRQRSPAPFKARRRSGGRCRPTGT